MKTYRHWSLMIAAAVAASAYAGPPSGVPAPTRRALPSFSVGSGVQDGVWFENFDSYASGAGIVGQGGWVAWCGTGPDGRVSENFARSTPNSLQIVTATDVVQDWANITTGQWVITLWTYVPTASGAGDGSINIMNNYCATVNPDWSVSVSFNATTGAVTTWNSLATTPLIKDQWVQYRCEVDLATDTFSDFYNNTPLDVNRSWSGGVAPGGLVRIDAVNTYSASLNGMYFDDCSLEEVGGCYPDCNGSGTLTVADFGCFQTQFVAGNMYADCNGSGNLTVADFGCFQTQFVAGCP